MKDLPKTPDQIKIEKLELRNRQLQEQNKHLRDLVGIQEADGSTLRAASLAWNLKRRQFMHSSLEDCLAAAVSAALAVEGVFKKRESPSVKRITLTRSRDLQGGVPNERTRAEERRQSDRDAGRRAANREAGSSSAQLG